MITSGGGFQGLAVLKGLCRTGFVRSVLVDSSDENIGKYFADKFFVVPAVSRSEEYMNALMHICDQEKIRIIIPATDIELPVLADYREVFRQKNIYVAVSDRNILTVLRNKKSLYAFLEKEGLPVLPLLKVTDITAHLPVIGKPLSGWGGRDIIIIENAEDLQKYDVADLENNFAWQPFLRDYEEYSMDCAIGFNGEVSDFMVRRRTKTIGGFAAICDKVSDARIEELTGDILQCIRLKGACGILNIQILKQGTACYVSDINPRIGTSAVFGYAFGVNPPLFMCSSIDPSLGYMRPSPEREKNIRMVRYLEEMWIEKMTDRNIRGIVFDLDDTLLNQKLWILEKLGLLWSCRRDALPDRQAFLSQAVQILEQGNRDRLFDALAARFFFADRLRDELICTYRQLEPESCPVYADVPPALAALRSMGFQLALLTDNPPESQRQKLKACGLAPFFHEIIFSRELGNIEKPDKEIFTEVAERLQAPVQSLAMVGDHLYRDIIGALDADFGAAFWIVREGTFFNFDQSLCERISERKHVFAKINTLRHLVWSFSGTGLHR